MANIGIRDGVISSSAQIEIQVPELRVKGDLIAENYIVSSSVTNIEYQSLSGSTIFGDSADDTHTFLGNTISGSLTSTGSFGMVTAGVSTAQAKGKLHVKGSATGAALGIIEDTAGNANFLIKATASNKNSILLFGDSASDEIGRIDYDHADNSMDLITNNSTALTIDSSGDLTVQGGRIYIRESDDGNNAVAITRDADEGYVQLFSSGTQTIEIRGNGSSYFNGGNVGINTTSPGDKLTIQGGNLQVTGSGGIGIKFVGTADGSNKNALYFRTQGGTEKYRIIHDQSADGTDDIVFKAAANSITTLALKQDGKVGIGTSSPGVALHVVGDIQLDDSAPFLLFKETGNNKDMQFKLQTDGRLSLLNDNGATEVLTVSQSGAVGIGTTNPEAKLHIQQATSSYALHLDMSTNKPNHSNGLFIAGVDENTTSYPLFIKTNSSTLDEGAGNVRFVVRADGKVGIGTASPAYRLQVSQAESAASDFQTNLDLVRTWDAGSSTDRYHGLIFSDSNSVNAGIFVNRLASHANYNSDLHFYTNAGSSNMTPATALSTSKMMITAAGLVGIGNTSPEFDLHVSSSAQANIVAESANFGIKLSADNDNNRAIILMDRDSTDGVGAGSDYSYIKYSSSGLDIGTGEDLPILFEPNGAERARITSAGIVLNSSAAHVSASATSTGSFGSLVVADKVQGSLTIADGVTLRDGPISIYNGGAQVIQLRHDTSQELIFRNGNNAKNKLVLTDTKISGSAASTGSFGQLTIGTSNAGYRAKITSNGDVDIRGVDPVQTISFGSNRPAASTTTFNSTNNTTLTLQETEKAIVSLSKTLISGSSTSTGSFAQGHVADKLGIGTTSPVYALVVNAGNDMTAHFKNDADRARLMLSDNDTDGFLVVQNSKMSVGLNNSVHANNLTLLDGHIGIGTTSPSTNYPITIAKSESDEYDTAAYARAMLRLENTNTDATQPHNLIHFRLEKNGGDGFLGFIAGGSTNEEHFVLGNQVDGEVLRVASGGNIGIGTVAPTVALEISGSGNLSSRARFMKAGGKVLQLGADRDTSSVPYIGAESNHAFDIITNNTQRVRVDASGNVGIGNTSPPKALSVTGEISSSGDINTAGQFEAGSAYTTSDRTLADFHGTRGKIKSKDNAVYLTTAAGGNRLEITDVANGNSAKGNILLQVSGQDADDKHLHLIPITDGVVTFSGANAKISGSSTSTGSFGSVHTAGDIGIGTTSPNNKLDVRRASDGIALELHSTVGDADEFVDFKMISGNTTAGTLGTIFRHQRQGSGGGDMIIFTNPGLTSTPLETIRFTSDQKVGIGTDSPGQGQSTPISDVKLDVLGNQMLSDLSTTNTDQSKLFFFRSDGAVASQGVVPDGLKIGAIEWAALTSGDNNNSISSARIETEASNTWSSAAVRNADIIFSTVGANSLTEKLRITSDAKISGSATSTGSFGSIQMPGLSIGDQSNVILGKNAGNAISSGDVNNVLIGENAGLSINAGEGNAIIGFSAGDALTSGDLNTAVGYFALSTSTDVDRVVAIGTEAMEAGNVTSAADGTVAIGSKALQNLTTGEKNIAIGFEALKTATELDDNVAIGYRALKVASGSAGKGRNIAIGALAGKAITSGEFNVLIGRSAGDQQTTANANTYMGYFAGYNTISGSENVFIGRQAGYEFRNANLPYNVYVGSFAGYHNRTGRYNTYLGGAAGYGASGNSHSNNVGVGTSALNDVTTGGDNVAIGSFVAAKLTTGVHNVFIGKTAADDMVEGSYNIAIGSDALGGLKDGTADASQFNIFMGVSSGNGAWDTAVSQYNIGIGHYTLDAAMNGAVNNTTVGHESLGAITTGDSNAALGYYAGNALTTGHSNVIIGENAGSTATTQLTNSVMVGNDAGQTAISANHVFIGDHAGYSAVASDGQVFIGFYAGGQVTSGERNLAIGYQALDALTVGDDNIAIGYQALTNLGTSTFANRNIAIGTYAMLSAANNNINDNIAIGYGALSQSVHSDGDNNVAIGTNAMSDLTAGSWAMVGVGQNALRRTNHADSVGSVAVGFSALGSNVSGIGNVAVGFQALMDMTTGDKNTAVGYEALENCVDGVNNTALGYQALTADAGNNNTGLGYLALRATTGAQNTAVGAQASVNMGGGANNVSLGMNSLLDVVDGSQNVAIGSQAIGGTLGTTADNASDLIAIGYQALGGNWENVALTDNIAIGTSAMGGAINGAINCIAIGRETLDGVLTTGANGTVGIGYQALKALTSGNGNTAVGYQALTTNIDGDRNTAVGYQALTTHEADTDGHGQNTALGYQAGGDVNTGTSNTFVGSRAGNQGTNDITTGDNNTLIGMEARASAAGAANQTVIGASAIGVANNSVTLGNADVTDVYMSDDAKVTGALVHCGGVSGSSTSTGSFGALHTAGRVGIGTTTQNSNLTIQTTAGSVDVAAATGTLQFGSVSSTLTPSIIGRQTAGTHGLFLMAMGLDGTTTGDMIFNTRENNNSTFATTANAGFKFQHFSTDLVTILRNGKVGIGVADPDSMLEVVGGAGATSINAHGVVKFRTTSNDSSELRHQFNMGGASDPGSYSIYQGNASTIGVNLAAGDVSYFNGGNVGIGTSSPSTMLHLKSSAGSTPKITIEDTNADDNFGALQFIKDSASPGTGDKLMQIWAYGDNDAAEQILYSEIATLPTSVADGSEEGSMRFRVMSGGSFVETMRVRANKVGIGTTSPGQELEVTGVISASSYVYAGDRVYVNNDLSLSHDGSSQLSVGFDSTYDKIRYGKSDDVVHEFKGTMISGSASSTGSFGTINLNGNENARPLFVREGNNAVGMGTSSPTATRLHAFSGTATSTGLVKFEASESTVDTNDVILVLDFSGDSVINTNNDYIQFRNSDGEVGRIHSEVSYGTFTGTHVSQRPSGSSYDDWKPGMIVKSTGNILATGSSMSLAWPEVELTTTQKDKAVMGVWDANNPSGSHQDKYLDRTLPRINYNAVGEGKIRVTDTGGNIETGDYICSSTRTGHGEKQDDDLLHNYTVAKATQPYNFASASNDSDLGYKSVLIACTYHCG